MTFSGVALPRVAVDAAPAAVERAPARRAMNKATFQAFYQGTAPALRAYIQRASGSLDLADDILQDAFLRYLRAAPADLEPSQRKAYLYRIAGSLLVDHWRRLNREQRWDWRAHFGGQTTHRNLELGPDLSKIFGTLKPQQRALLWLAYVEGFEHREIASMLALREKSVRVLLFRARRKLADLLKEKGLGPEVRP